MSEHLLRQWTMLQLIPTDPGWTTAGELKNRLDEAGYPMTKRSVERDLDKLATPFNLVCDDAVKPYRWYWLGDTKAMSVPGMDPVTALTFHLADEFLRDLLPAQARQRLQGHVQQAREVLKASDQSLLADWPDRVVVIPPGQRLQPPEIKPEVMDAVSNAILRERKLELTYRPRMRAGKPKEHLATPLGLVVRAHVTYLVCHLHTGPDPSHLAMHRIETAEVSHELADYPESFNLQTYVEEGFFDYPVGDDITLVASFEPRTAYHLSESPLHPDQTAKEDDDGWIRITAKVQDTQQLRWWLLGFGPRVQVLRPKRLKNELAMELKEAARHY